MTSGGGVDLPGEVRDALPRVRAALVRRLGQIELAEDALGEALLAAAARWPVEGRPESPQAWLLTVASRRAVDLVRSDRARREREHHEAVLAPPGGSVPSVADERPPAADDTLALLVMCCHPDLTPASQVALSLRAVGGLGTPEIARGLLVPETTVAQRISRARSTLRTTTRPWTTLEGAPAPEAADRLAAVHQVLYLVFTEGHTATSGADLMRTDLAERGIALAREVHEARPGAGDSAGLLALMLLTHARAPSRRDGAGRLVPLAEQDRGRWDRELVAEGLALTAEAVRRRPVGGYALQAAIAAVHAESSSVSETDWRQIVALYRLLRRVADGPAVQLNLAVALAMAEGPEAALAALPDPAASRSPSWQQRRHAVRGHLLAMIGQNADARAEWSRAEGLATNPVETDFLADLRAAPG